MKNFSTKLICIKIQKNISPLDGERGGRRERPADVGRGGGGGAVPDGRDVHGRHAGGGERPAGAAEGGAGGEEEEAGGGEGRGGGEDEGAEDAAVRQVRRQHQPGKLICFIKVVYLHTTLLIHTFLEKAAVCKVFKVLFLLLVEVFTYLYFTVLDDRNLV